MWLNNKSGFHSYKACYCSYINWDLETFCIWLKIEKIGIASYIIHILWEHFVSDLKIGKIGIASYIIIILLKLQLQNSKP